MVPLKVTVAPVDVLSPVAGVHTYVLPPVAVMVVVAPRQIVELPAVVAIVGGVLTVSTLVAVALQPVVALVPVTV